MIKQNKKQEQTCDFVQNVSQKALIIDVPHIFSYKKICSFCFSSLSLHADIPHCCGIWKEKTGSVI